MTTHELKTWPEYYEPVAAGLKTWEYRKDDRPYAAGDVLHLREWCPMAYEDAWQAEQRTLVGDPISRPDVWEAAADRAIEAAYTGCACRRRVTYIARGGLVEPGYVVMSIVEEPTP